MARKEQEFIEEGNKEYYKSLETENIKLQSRIVELETKVTELEKAKEEKEGTIQSIITK